MSRHLHKIYETVLFAMNVFHLYPIHTMACFFSILLLYNLWFCVVFEPLETGARFDVVIIDIPGPIIVINDPQSRILEKFLKYEKKPKHMYTHKTEAQLILCFHNIQKTVSILVTVIQNV